MPILFSINDAPPELQAAIKAFWPESEWDNAASIAKLESNWNAFAILDSTGPNHPCGTVIDHRDGVAITAERSIGYFQLNSCNFPDWDWRHFFNGWHNAGTAHMLWDQRGWSPWFFSARKLGLIWTE